MAKPKGTKGEEWVFQTRWALRAKWVLRTRWAAAQRGTSQPQNSKTSKP